MRGGGEKIDMLLLLIVGAGVIFLTIQATFYKWKLERKDHELSDCKRLLAIERRKFQAASEDKNIFKRA